MAALCDHEVIALAVSASQYTLHDASLYYLISAGVDHYSSLFM